MYKESNSKQPTKLHTPLHTIQTKRDPPKPIKRRMIIMTQTKYTKKQKEAIESMVTGFRKVHSRERRLELLNWYDFASGVKNIEITKQIMIDLKAI
jgi:hypothetical protein